jgi:hypothetical protein
MAELRNKSEYGIILGGLAVILSSLALGFFIGNSRNVTQNPNNQPVSFSPPTAFAAPAPTPIQTNNVTVTKIDCTDHIKKFAQYSIYGSYGDKEFPIYLVKDDHGNKLKSIYLERDGYEVNPFGSCMIQVKKDSCTSYVLCSTSVQIAQAQDK